MNVCRYVCMPIIMRLMRDTPLMRFIHYLSLKFLPVADSEI